MTNLCIIADIKRKKVGGRLIMFGSNEQIDLLLNSTVWFCDVTFKTRPLLFEQVYIIQCLVGDEGIFKMITFFSVTEMLGSVFSFSVFPAIYALTSNRKRKTYEEIIGVVLNLAADRKTILSVKTIVSDY